MNHRIGSLAYSYGVALGSVAVATWLHMLANPLLGDRAPYITYFPAVFVTAILTGFVPTIVAVVLSAIAAARWFIPPPEVFFPVDAGGWVALGFFTVFGVGMAVLAETIHRRADQVQRERERFSVTLASIGDGVIVTDERAQVTFMNAVAEELTGSSQADALGKPLDSVFRIINEHSREPCENPVEKALREGRIVGLANHTILLTNDGRERFIDDSAAPIRDSGAILGVVLVFRDVSDQRSAQLEQSRLAAIVDTSEDAILGQAFDGTVTAWNDAAERLFGFSAEEAVGKSMFDLIVPPERRQELCDALEQIRKGERLDQFESVRRHRDGHRIPVAIRISPIENADGEIVGASAIDRDISERKEAEARLFEGEERLRLALEAGRMGTWEWYVESGEVNWSPTLEALHGLAPGSFPGTFEAFQKDIHPGDRDRVLETIRQSVEEGREHHLEYRVVWPDGSMHWLEARGRLFRNEAGRPVRLVGVCLDITGRKWLEQSLRFLAEASKSLAMLIDYKSTLQKVAHLAVPGFADWCAVDMLDADGALKRVAVAHVDPDKVQLAEDLHRRHPPDPEASRGAMKVLRTGEPELLSRIDDALIEAAAPDEEYGRILRELNLRSYICVPLQVKDRILGTITFVSAESGRIYGKDDLAMAEDLAHRAAIAVENARLYQEVRDADRRKDEFLAMLAHELRNPLAPIRSGLDILAMNGAQGEDHHETIHLMQEQVEHVVRLVDDLLDVSRIMRGKIELRKEPVELSTVVQRSVNAVRPLIESHDQELGVFQAEAPIWLNVDPVRIVQVFENLLNNASKYTDAGGRIEISTSLQNSEAVIRISDTGIGIEPDLLPNVFELFTQSTRSLDRAQGGLGIGLTLVERLVGLHGGSVSAHSEGSGQGSTFTVRLPVASPVTQHPKHIEKPPMTHSRRILVVDDNVGAARVLAKLLTQIGDHEVETAHDGPSAFAKVKSSHPEIVLLDIGLPGMDGYQVGKSIRELPEFDDVLLVALTGYGQAEDRERSKEVGFDEHLVKPPSVDQMKKVLSHPKLAARN